MHSLPKCIVMLVILTAHKNVHAEECGTRFTDFTSSVVLAEVVLEGTITDFHSLPLATGVRSANVTVSNVYKGMDVLKSLGGMDGAQQVMVQSFGQKNEEDCIASDEDVNSQDMVYFLRQSRGRRSLLEHSALPLPHTGNEEQLVKRAMCDKCVQPPRIRRLVCKDCAKLPVIKPMKSKKAIMGRRARLRCAARGKPAPKFSWFKGQIPVISTNRGITIKTTNFTSTLIFSKTTSAHSGQYKCIAANEVGEAEDFVNLEISRKPKRNRNEAPTRSVQDAADRVVCEANPCMYGGTCYFSPSLNLRQCVCTMGFEGVRCENIHSVNTIKPHNRATMLRNDKSRNEESKTSQVTEIAKEMNATTTHTTPPGSSSTTVAPVNNVITQHPTLPSTKHPAVGITNINHLTNSKSSNNSEQPTIHGFRPKTSLPDQATLRPTNRYSSNGQVLPNYPVKRKSGLKIVFCRDKQYCNNKGKCKYIIKLNKKFCQCRKGYGGTRCEHTLY